MPGAHAVRRFPMRSVGGALALTLVLVAVAVGNTWRIYAAFQSMESTRLRLVELAGTIKHLDEVLTMSARMAVASGDLSWEARYKKFEPVLDAAITEAIELAPDAYASAAATDTEAANVALVDLETRAFAAVREGHAGDGQPLVFGPEYARQKEIYSAGMSAMLSVLHHRATDGAEDYRRGMLASMCVAFVTLVFIALAWTRVFRLTRGYLRERNLAIDELRVANETLENRVRERTRELSEAQEQVVASARAAGMAEVAAGVLHNVGNVLNTINVAAQVTTEALKGCRIDGVRKAAGMMTTARADLPALLGSERGRLLASYLCEATANVAEQHERACTELAVVRTSVEHVKAIISTQQTYARAGAHVQSFELAEVVVAAVQLCAATLNKHEIEIARRVPEGIAMTTDKHRLLQILMNLMTNAIHAICAAPAAPRSIEISAAQTGDRVELRVVDRGIGIDADAMKQLFRHGFTTKVNGHGFGLHSSANAADELGGTIRAESEGTGRGAAFMVELPCQYTPRGAQPAARDEVRHAS